MSAKYVSFFLIKLILILFASLAAFLVAFLLSMTLPESADKVFSGVLTGIVPSAVFFAFIYSFESKIKIPGNAALKAKYFLMFTLKETSVYAIFALIPNIVTAAAGAGILDGGFISNLILPHMSTVKLGLPIAVNYIIFTALYAAVSFVAHYMRSKRPISVHAQENAAEETEVNNNAD